MDPPTFGEWNEALNKCSLNTAPGISGITYLLIKKLHPIVHELLRSFAGKLYVTALIPMEWKTSQIFPIPKPTNWKFNLEKTRPIILLECLRKLTVRVINTRIAHLCLEQNITLATNYKSWMVSIRARSYLHSSGVSSTILSCVELWMMNHWVILCL